MREYDHKKIEKKWQEIWEKKGIYHAKDLSSKPKYYSLIEFPYPSGDGLHVGHPRPYIGMDVISRTRRLQGFNDLQIARAAEWSGEHRGQSASTANP